MGRYALFILAAALAALAGCGQATPDPGDAAASAAPRASAATPASSPSPTPTINATATSPPSPTPLPTIEPSPTACAETRGRMISDRIPSSTLRQPIDARIYLPPCYRASDERYPVLYLFHGLNFTEDQWERLGVPATADQLIAAGEIAPLIVVMPRDQGDTWLDPAFVTEVLPFIDGRYRTLAEREFRAIGGLSRGAGWSVHLGLHYPEHFSRVGAHSPALFYDDENSLIEWMNRISRSGVWPAVYVDIGQGDARQQSAFWLDQHLEWFKFGHTYILRPGDHSEKYWSTHLPEYLRFYAGEWLEE
jgi:enterochelin esterase-like enzyme